MEMLAQHLLPIESQPQEGLIPKFGHRPFPEPEERMKHPEFRKSFVGHQVSDGDWQGYLLSIMEVRGRGERQTLEA